MWLWLLGIARNIKNLFAIVLGGIVVYLLNRNKKLKQDNNNLKQKIDTNEKFTKNATKVIKILSENNNTNLDGTIERMRRDEL